MRLPRDLSGDDLIQGLQHSKEELIRRILR